MVQHLNDWLLNPLVVLIFRIAERQSDNLILSCGQIEDGLRAADHETGEELLECLSCLFYRSIAPQCRYVFVEHLWIIVWSEVEEFEEAEKVCEVVLDWRPGDGPS